MRWIGIWALRRSLPARTDLSIRVRVSSGCFTCIRSTRRIPLADRQASGADGSTWPSQDLEAAARHFGVTQDAATLEATLAGPLFSTCSKNPGVAFDNTARVAREAEQRTLLAGDLVGGGQIGPAPRLLGSG